MVITDRPVKFDSLSTYEAVIHEAKRVTRFPRWIHLAALCEYAQTAFGITQRQFHQDSECPVSHGRLSRWVHAMQIWHAAPLALKRKSQNAVVVFDRAAGIARVKGISDQAALRHVLSHKAEIANEVYVQHAIHSLAAILSGRTTPTRAQATQLVKLLRAVAKLLEGAGGRVRKERAA